MSSIGSPVDARGALSDPMLVAIYLRGAADGLDLVPPTGDDEYYALRPDLAISEDDAITLDGLPLVVTR